MSNAPIVTVQYQRRIVCAGDSETTVPAYNTCYSNKLQARLGPFAYIINAGVSGNQTSDLLARFAVDVTSQRPSDVVLCIGIVDTFSGTASATTIANITTMINTLVAANITPRLMTLLPYGNYVGWSAANETKRNDVNTFIKSQ